MIDRILGNFYIDWDEYQSLVSARCSVHTIYNFSIDEKTMVFNESKQQRLSQYLLRVVCKETSHVLVNNKKVDYKEAFEIINENSELIGEFLSAQLYKHKSMPYAPGEKNLISLSKKWAEALDLL